MRWYIKYLGRYMYIYIYLCVCVCSVCLYLYLSLCLSICLPVYLSACLSIFLSLYAFMVLSPCLYLYVIILIYIYIYMCVSQYIYRYQYTHFMNIYCAIHFQHNGLPKMGYLDEQEFIKYIWGPDTDICMKSRTKDKGVLVDYIMFHVWGPNSLDTPSDERQAK